MAFASGLAARAGSAGASRPSVLLIAIDDLNDWVGHLGGHSQASTPHIDRLARQGVAFTHAYSPSPLCTPSRVALMTGVRPSTMGMVGRDDDWPAFPDVPTLPQYFRSMGYEVAGTGKIYHEHRRRETEWHDSFHEGSSQPVPTRGARQVGPLRFGALDTDDEQMRDFAAVQWAERKLARRGDRPLFLACGIHKPHLPWYVPRRYFEQHPLEGIRLPVVREGDLDDVPPAGRTLADDGLHAAVLRSGYWKEAVQAYLAAISFADAMVGRLLDALERGPHRDHAVVVLTSDNGWHLGEKQHWRKFTLWEESTRVPLVVTAPGAAAGRVCTRAVDLTSVYRTLTDLVGLAPPNHLEGKGLADLVRNPSAPWTTPALTSYLGHSAVRSEQWRYIRYADGAEELYDAGADPHEWDNVASLPRHATVKSELRAWIPTVSGRALGSR